MKGVFTHEIDKRAVFSSNLIHQILDNTNGGINVVDTDGILVYVNNVSANYLNQKREKYDRKTHFPILSCRRSSNSVRKSSSHSG